MYRLNKGKEEAKFLPSYLKGMWENRETFAKQWGITVPRPKTGREIDFNALANEIIRTDSYAEISEDPGKFKETLEKPFQNTDFSSRA